MIIHYTKIGAVVGKDYTDLANKITHVSVIHRKDI